MKIGSSSVTKFSTYVLCDIAPFKPQPNYGSFAVASYSVSDFLLEDSVDVFIRDSVIRLASEGELVQHELHVGNKSINQLKLWKYGCHIPHTVILDFSFYDLFKKNGEVKLKAIYDQQIAYQLGPSLAVRCSSNKEDREEYSFAGTFDTYLNVANDFEAFKEKVLESFVKFSLMEENYSDFRTSKLRLGVMVQNMVQPKFSGFLFTTDPMNPPSKWLKVEYWEGERDKSDVSSLTLNKENGKTVDANLGKRGVSLPLEVRSKLHELTQILDKQFNSPSRC